MYFHLGSGYLHHLLDDVLLPEFPIKLFIPVQNYSVIEILMLKITHVQK